MHRKYLKNGVKEIDRTIRAIAWKVANTQTLRIGQDSGKRPR